MQTPTHALISLPNAAYKQLSPAPTFSAPSIFCLTLQKQKANSCVSGFSDIFLTDYPVKKWVFCFSLKGFHQPPPASNPDYCHPRHTQGICFSLFPYKVAIIYGQHRTIPPLSCCSSCSYVPPFLATVLVSSILFNIWADIQDLCHFSCSRSLPDNVQTRGMTS